MLIVEVSRFDDLITKGDIEGNSWKNVQKYMSDLTQSDPRRFNVKFLTTNQGLTEYLIRDTKHNDTYKAIVRES